MQAGLLTWLMSLGTTQLALTHPSVNKVRTPDVPTLDAPTFATCEESIGL